MGKGGKVGSKRNFRNRVRANGSGSDDSDEDYVVEDEENLSEDDSEDLVNSVDGYASEETYGSFVEEEEEEEEVEEEEEFGKVSRLKKHKGFLNNGKIGGKTSQKRKRVSYDDDEEEEEEEVEEEEEFGKVSRSKKHKGSLNNGKIGGKTSQKRKRVSYDEEDDEDYVEEDEDDDDEEFTIDEDEDGYEDDCMDEDEEFAVKKKKNGLKARKGSFGKKNSKRGHKRRRKSGVSKKPLVKKTRKARTLRKKNRSINDDEGDADFTDYELDACNKSKKTSVSRRRKYAVCADSDFESSASSDYDYTISEEEREQVREANVLCGELKINLRSLSSVKRNQENGDLSEQIKPPARKGKEKVKEVKPEVGKQVCGICLSEEDKRRFRGNLDCCSHYFCFTCIMEWAKVESRCPLCKQRFKTITKNGRSAIGVDLRNMVIEVPKRDQVYQPSEEEIRSFIDPYENVICTECHQGGDDGLMLLCDICDSPAHTYCVGLGHQVPEGNWYCEGCRPVVLGSSSSQAQDPLPDQRTSSINVINRLSPMVNLGQGIDSTIESSPRAVLTQGPAILSSPRFPAGDVQATSPVPGTGAPTLSGRRQIQRHIQNLLSSRMNLMACRTDGTSAISLHPYQSNPLIDQGTETSFQNSSTQGVGTSEHAFCEERLQGNDHPSSSLQDRDSFTFRQSQFGRLALQDPTVTSSDRSVNLTLWPDVTRMNSMPGFEQLGPYNGISTIGPDSNLCPYIVREENQFYTVKEQLQSLVKSHLRTLSQDTGLANETFKEIARSSTHTILAACGLEHKRSEVQRFPPPSVCTHVDRYAAGQTSLMKGFCSSCFDSYVRDVVKRIMDTRLPQWLSLGL